MSGAFIETVGLTRGFGRERHALDDVTLSISRGEFVAVTGPSGCGKTTLLSLIGALDRPSGGSVIFDGRDLASLSGAAKARLRRRIGIVFQQSHMIPRLPLWENVTVPLVPRGMPASERKEIAVRWLARMDLADRADSRPEELSGGEQRRVGVARALVGQPELILADEPTSDLDTKTADCVRDLFDEFLAEGGTLVLATHDAALDAERARVLRLERGRLVS